MTHMETAISFTNNIARNNNAFVIQLQELLAIQDLEKLLSFTAETIRDDMKARTNNN